MTRAYQVEGLVRDNRVEVRVLFGACQRPRMAGLFRWLGPARLGGGEFRVATPLAIGGAFCPQSAPTLKESGMGVHYDAGRRKYVVRWQDDGRRRSRRFAARAKRPPSRSRW